MTIILSASKYLVFQFIVSLIIPNKGVETASLSSQYSVSIASNETVLLLLLICISQTCQSLFVIETSQESRQH